MSTWHDIIKDYQTLIAGMLAILAAVIAFIGAIKAARTQADAALSAAKAQIIHLKEEGEALLQRRRTAFTFALRLAAFRIKQQAQLLSDLLKDKEFVSNVSRNILHQQKIPVPQVLRSQWEDMALLEERFQIMTDDLVIKTENANTKLDEWIEYYELCNITKQEGMQDIQEEMKAIDEPALNKDLDDVKESAQQLIDELQEWIEQRGATLTKGKTAE